MKKLLIVLVCVLFCLTAANAKSRDRHNGRSDHGYNDPVMVPAMNFSAEYSGSAVAMQWKRYLRGDLKFYKVVKSETTPDPIYPEDGYIFYSANASDTSFEDTKITPGTWYYRLCIITRGGDRWISPVVMINIEDRGGKIPDASDFE